MLDGYNVCIFAYGQSGTGKTHTMEGSDEQPGLAPRAMHKLFGEMDARTATGNFEQECYISMIEIYNENIRDLLGDPKRDMSKDRFDILQDSSIGMCAGSEPWALGVTSHRVTSHRVLSHHLTSRRAGCVGRLVGGVAAAPGAAQAEATASGRRVVERTADAIAPYAQVCAQPYL